MNAAAIKKLRRDFILTAMLSFIAVMVFTGGLINISNNLQIQRIARDILDYIVENNGELPSHDEDGSEDLPSEAEPGALYQFSPEIRYSTRYFAVLYGPERKLREVKLGHIHSVDRDEAIDTADSILRRKASFGTIGQSFYYRTAQYNDGSCIAVVMDASTLIDLNRNIIRSTVMICGIGLLLTLFAVLAVSGHMIQPEIENARRQKMFITNASHELKTPLSVIRANTELEELMNGESEWTQSTLRQVDRLNGLIQNLVMIARAQEAEDPDILGDIDASAAILETVRPYESLALQQGKSLTLDIISGIHMTADESRIRQLAVLLIDNAFKYCDDKGAVSVSFSRYRLGRQVRLIVSNTYAAGKDVDYSRFFERFYREDSSHTADGSRGGYGIGLSIAESICTQYKGSIKASWKDDIITFTCLLGI